MGKQKRSLTMAKFPSPVKMQNEFSLNDNEECIEVVTLSSDEEFESSSTPIPLDFSNGKGDHLFRSNPFNMNWTKMDNLFEKHSGSMSTISKDERDSNRVKNEAKSPSEPEIITIDDLTSAEFLADVSEISAEDWFNNQLVIDPPANGVFLGDLTIGEKSANSAASQSAEVMESPSSSKEPRVFSRCFRKSDQNESEGLLDTEKMLPHLHHTPLNESARVFDGDSSFPYRTGMFESSAAESEEESHICEQNLDTNRRLWVAPSLSCDGQTAKTAEKILPRITPCLVRIEALTTAQLEEFGLTNLISSRGRSCTSAHSELPCVGVDSKGEPAASCGPLKKYPLRSRNRGTSLNTSSVKDFSSKRIRNHNRSQDSAKWKSRKPHCSAGASQALSVIQKPRDFPLANSLTNEQLNSLMSVDCSQLFLRVLSSEDVETVIQAVQFGSESCKKVSAKPKKTSNFTEKKSQITMSSRGRQLIACKAKKAAKQLNSKNKIGRVPGKKIGPSLTTGSRNPQNGLKLWEASKKLNEIFFKSALHRCSTPIRSEAKRANYEVGLHQNKISASKNSNRPHFQISTTSKISRFRVVSNKQRCHLSCPFCLFDAPNSTLLTEHKSSNHPFRCDKCMIVRNSKDEILQHYRSEHSDATCTLCDLPCGSVAKLKSHMTTQNHLRAQKIYERLKEQFERQTPTLNHSNSIAVSNPKPSDPTDGSLDDEKELVGYICMASPQQEKPFETEFPILLGDIGKDGEVRLNETRLASCHQQVSDVPDWTMNIDTIQTLNLSALNNAPIGISGSEPSTSHQDNFEFLFGVEELNPFLIGDDLGYAISSYDQQLNNVTNSELSTASQSECINFAASIQPESVIEDPTFLTFDSL